MLSQISSTSVMRSWTLSFFASSVRFVDMVVIIVAATKTHKTLLGIICVFCAFLWQTFLTMSEVVVTSLTNLRNEVRYGAGHSFITDEPVAAGGEDAGPDPYTLLLAALGSCIS